MVESIKIAQINPGPIPVPPPKYGAIERHIYYLTKYLRHFGVDVEIINKKPRGDQYKSIKFILSKLRREKFDLVHTHGSFVSGIVAPLYPSVFTSHTPAWISEKNIYDRWGMIWEIIAVKSALGVISLTPDIKKMMMKYTPKNIRVIPNGVDCQKYYPKFEERTHKRIVSVGKIVPHKNFHLLAKVTRKTPYEVLIIGKPENKEYIKKLKSINPTLKFQFNVSDEELINLLATADLYVHPSKKEAMSIAVLEAMASGLPIIGSEMCKYQIWEGKNGYVAYTEDDFRRLIREIMDDPEKLIKMGRNSRELALRFYNWPVIAKEVYKFYKILLRKENI